MKYRLLPLFLLVFAFSVAAQNASSVNRTDFAAVTMDGTTVDTTQLRGKIVVVNIWFVGCPNCQEEIEQLNSLVEEYRDSKDVVFIAPAATPRAEVEKFLSKHPFKYQIVPNAATLILAKFGTPDKNGEINIPFPMHYVLDRDGKVAVQVQGIKGIAAVRAELRKQVTVDAPLRTGAVY